MDKPREECGIIGIYSKNRNVASDIYFGLIALQHRGQESCGIAVNRDREISYYKDLGLVNEVFDAKKLSELDGNMGIGHVRYSTSGSVMRENAQPLVLRYLKGALAIAHNGHLVNTKKLREEYEQGGAIYQTTCDTETMAYTFARERVKSKSIQEAINASMSKLTGAYSVVVMSPKKLIAVKDPWGFRPLCMGRKGDDIVFASETCALDCLGVKFERELDPGEIVIVEDGKVTSIRDNCADARNHVCIFEYIYFARPDSVIGGRLVSDARRLAGKFLAQERPVDADIVIGVPDSALPAALGYAMESGIPYEEGFLKNRYITRTFIMPDQSSRSLAVGLKLNPIKKYVEGKRVCMVDDSIVRGTTTQKIIKSLRDAGAKEVHVRISSPPFLWPCYFGTDVPSRKELVAVNQTLEEFTKNIGADSLAYLSVEKLGLLLSEGSDGGYCRGCFTGKYPVDEIEGEGI